MLRGLQKATSNWLGRIVTGVILGLIAISFAVWGVGDIFRGFGRSTLAKIGSTEITVEQFRNTYNERLQQLTRQLGRPISTDQAIALGLPRQLLGQIIAESALDENARQMRLGASDSDIAKRIMSDPNFRGPTGQFDRTRFEFVIRQAGYTEQRFVNEQRRVTLRREIAEAVSGGITVPQAAIELQHRFRNEERSLEFLTLDRAQAGEIPQPSEDDLVRYFEERKTLFRAPEYRAIDIFVLSPQDKALWAQISDADARKAYEDRRSRYVTPERRNVQQMVFPNTEEARAAAERIGQGATFEQIATERGLKESDINLGLVAKAGMLDSAVADAAFKLQSGQVSEPVAGRFGTVLVRVTAIEPEKVRPFDEVAADIKTELAQERAKSDIVDQYNKIEDERGAGDPLKEVLERLGFQTRRIEAVDRSGRDPAGNTLPGLPAGIDLVGAAFGSDAGVENDPLRLPDGGYAWFDVISTTPSRERPLSEVRDRVEERWREDEIAARLKKLADDLAEKLKGSSLAEVAAAAGLQPRTERGLKRNTVSDTVPPRALDAVFRTGKGEVGQSEGNRATMRIVFRVTDIGVPPLDRTAQEARQIEDSLRNAMFEDLLSQYVVRLQADLGTRINEGALNQILTGATQN